MVEWYIHYGGRWGLWGGWGAGKKALLMVPTPKKERGREEMDGTRGGRWFQRTIVIAT